MAFQYTLDKHDWKVQKYESDGWGFLQTYQDINEVLNDPALIGVTVVGIRNAVSKRQVYMGHRWALLNKCYPDNSLQQLNAPASSKNTFLRHGYSEVYAITSPPGRQYVGKADSHVRQSGREVKWGTLGRWKSHCDDAKRDDGGRCRKLNMAIRKYGADNMLVTPLMVCRTKEIQECEKKTIEKYKTKHPYGMNLNDGGNSSNPSAETRKLMSIGQRRSHALKPRTVKPDTRQRIRETNINNAKRYDHHGNELPKYMKWVNHKNRKGYAVMAHPLCKKRDFASTLATVDLDDKYRICQAHLAVLNARLAAGV